MASMRMFSLLLILGSSGTTVAQTCPSPWGIDQAALDRAVEQDPRIRLARGEVMVAELGVATSISRPAPELRVSGEIPSDPLASAEPVSVGLRFRTGRLVDNRTARMEATTDLEEAQRQLQLTQLEIRADLLDLVVSYALVNQQLATRETRADATRTTCQKATTATDAGADLTSLEVAQVCLESALVDDDVLRLRQLQRNLKAELDSHQLGPLTPLATWVALPDVANVVASAQALHPDTAAALIRLELSQTHLATQRLSLLPHLSFLQGGVNLVSEGRTAWTWGVGVEIPIPGYSDHALAQARAQQQLANLGLETTSQELDRRVRQAWVTTTDLTLRTQQWGGVLIPAADKLATHSREALAAGQIQLLDAWKSERQVLQIHEDYLDLTLSWWTSALELDLLSGGALTATWHQNCSP